MKTSNATQTALPIEEASVQERQVSVKVLTMGTKQVTQSLYRQLVCNTDVIDHFTCELKGQVWGWVNLHLDCNMADSHLHVIWQKDGCLYRSCTYAKCSQVFYIGSQSSLYLFADIYCCLKALEGSMDELRLLPMRHSIPGSILIIKGRRVEFPVSIPWEVKRCDFPRIEQKLEDIKKKLELDGYPIWDKDVSTSEKVYTIMEQLVDTMNTEEQKWRQTYQTIKDAGQLFIAVSGVWK